MKKVKMLVETYLPPSVRGRIWKWLLAAPSISHQQYQTHIDSFDIPQLDIDPSLLKYVHSIHITPPLVSTLISVFIPLDVSAIIERL